MKSKKLDTAHSVKSSSMYGSILVELHYSVPLRASVLKYMIHAVRPVLDVDSCGDSLSVTVMVNPLCTETEYPVLVTFGAQVISSDTCEGQENATLMLLSPGESATFSVDRDTVTLRDNEEYCYIISINGEAGELTACTINIYSTRACTYHNVMHIHHECGQVTCTRIPGMQLALIPTALSI